MVTLSEVRSACEFWVTSSDVLSSRVFCLKTSERLPLDSADFTACEMAVDMVAERALTSKETNPGLLIGGSGAGGSVAVSSDVRTRLERVWRPVLDGCPGRFLGGITYR